MTRMDSIVCSQCTYEGLMFHSGGPITLCPECGTAGTVWVNGRAPWQKMEANSEQAFRPAWATFDENEHAVTPGWATYHRKPMLRFRLRCWLGRHVLPDYVPQPPNGYSPSNHDRCPRCRAHLGWYVTAQHRFGGLAK